MLCDDDGGAACREAAVPAQKQPRDRRVSHQNLGGRWRRRRFLGVAAAGCAYGVAAGLAGGPLGSRAAQAAMPGGRGSARRLSLYSLNTEESLSTVFWQDGRLVPDALAEIDYHLRDFRTGDVRTIDPGLLDLLHALGRVMDYDRPIHVISGYRCPKTNAMLAARSNGVAKNSFHVRGMAIDIRLPGRDLATLRRAAMQLSQGGVGFYPKSDFVHVDTGPVRRW
jgi:uncharacterized protein YcbK (DUF882 family)